MTIRISYIDNGDDTGGVVRVTGSDATATNTLLFARHFGGMGAEAIRSAGSRTGDGDIAISAIEGPYFAFLRSVTETVEYSVPLSFRVYSEELPIQERLAVAIRDAVLGLSLEGVPSDPALHKVAKVGAKLEQVVREADPKEAVFYLPAPEGYRVGDNGMNDISFPVVISLLKESRQTLKEGLRDVQRFRDKVMGSLSECELDREVYEFQFLPGAVIDPSQWLDNFDASNFTVVCRVLRPAGAQ